MRAAYPESVLHFENVAIQNGGLHITGDGDYFCDFSVSRRKDGLSHLFKELFSTDFPLPFCKEAVLSVDTVLGLDLTRRVVLNTG